MFSGLLYTHYESNFQKAFNSNASFFAYFSMKYCTYIYITYNSVSLVTLFEALSKYRRRRIRDK